MSALQLLWATLQEIFDEAAYDRFLKANRMLTSRASYEKFQQDRRSMQERKPRCC